jgi:hypothetical protein
MTDSDDRLVREFTELLALSDDELMRRLGLEHGTIQSVRAQIDAMDDEDLIDEFGLDENQSAAELRAELAAMDDAQLMLDCRVSSPQSERAYMESWRCLFCRKWTCDEYYMLRDEIWMRAVGQKDGMACIGCVEERLGRMLTHADFTDAVINHSGFSPDRSARLTDRLNR